MIIGGGFQEHTCLISYVHLTNRIMVGTSSGLYNIFSDSTNNKLITGPLCRLHYEL